MTTNETSAGVLAVTRMIPDGTAAFEKQGTQPREFTGFDVGPFFAHPAMSDDEMLYVSNEMEEAGYWHLTLRSSGFAVLKCIPTHARAIWLAKQLLQFDCWTGATREEVLAGIPAEMKAQIFALREQTLDDEWDPSALAAAQGAPR